MTVCDRKRLIAGACVVLYVYRSYVVSNLDLGFITLFRFRNNQLIKIFHMHFKQEESGNQAHLLQLAYTLIEEGQ